MQEEQLLSVGIDIGTSTTQCVFSLLTLSNTASSFSVPKIRITDKKILFRAPVRLTPLLSYDTIDADKVKSLIQEDYQSANIDPSQVRLGAVIITGETARKQNARAVTDALSKLAGDFVVATAGPALESVLAGRGSGAAELSEQSGRRVLNLDIGGGTANMALFERGESVSDGCLDIGGRLLRFEDDNHTVLFFSEAIKKIADDCGLPLHIGDTLSDAQIARLAQRMSGVLEEAAGLAARTPLHDALIVGHSLPNAIDPEIITFSGGVADCIYSPDASGQDFHDLGLALGKAIAQSRFFTDRQVLKPTETSHATVIGAGAYSASVSGSTIYYRNITFPIPSLPVGRIEMSKPEHIGQIARQVENRLSVFDGECAIYFEGIRAPSYVMIEQIADALCSSLKNSHVRIIIMQEDMAKALGQSMARRLGKDTSFLCMDGISLLYGDTVDIGEPLSDGRVLPVIVKTLAFS